MKVAFVGAGNMATAMIAGLVKARFPAHHICASGPREEKLRLLEERYGIAITTDNLTAARDADLIFIAVKPQQVKPVFQELTAALQGGDRLFISVAAGVEMASLRAWSHNCPVLRCMPNLPVQSCAGVSGLYGVLGEAQKKRVESLLQLLGQVVWVESDAKLNAVIALAGSGPAYYYLFIDAMIKAGREELGLSPQQATQLSLQTAFGAVQTAKESAATVAELQRQVTSPGGTTAAAIDVFESHHMQDVVAKALKAAVVRAEQMHDTLKDR